MFETREAIDWAALISGLLVLVLIVLSLRVVMGRRKHRVLIGDGGIDEMMVAGRIFGNAAEYIPAAIGVLILMALIGCPIWAVQLIGAMMLIGRIVHPFGMKSTGGVTPPRLIGMSLTWLSLIGGAGFLIVCSLLG